MNIPIPYLLVGAAGAAVIYKVAKQQKKKKFSRRTRVLEGIYDSAFTKQRKPKMRKSPLLLSPPPVKKRLSPKGKEKIITDRRKRQEERIREAREKRQQEREKMQETERKETEEIKKSLAWVKQQLAKK